MYHFLHQICWYNNTKEYEKIPSMPLEFIPISSMPLKNRNIWILAITISQVLKNAITILLIGNLPLQLLIQHIHALIYVSREAGPTGRRRILV